MLKKLLLSAALFAICIIPSLQAQNNAQNYPTMKYREFVPTEPIEYFADVELAEANGGVVMKYIKTLTKTEMLKFLTNETVLTAVAEVDKNGNMSYIPTRTSEKKKQYIVTMDYLKFSTIEIKKEGELIGEACVGVGIRLIANISSKAENVNLGDLFSIGMAVKEKQVYGSLRIEVIGLHDPSITSSIPLPSEISSATIQTMMQTMSMVKQKIYEDGINLSPQIVGIRAVKEGVTLPDLNEAMLAYHKIGKKNATQSPNSTSTKIE
jgi:hypothetical protein